MSNQPAEPLGTKTPLADAPVAATNVPKYSKNDLQGILKIVLEAQAPAPTLAHTSVVAPAPTLAHTSVVALAPTLAPALIITEAPREKLKDRSPNVL